MRKKPIFNEKSNQTFSGEIYSGEDIHEKLDRILNTDQPIEADPSLQKIYTKRKDGVIPELDIRTDKWDMALEAMDSINASKIASAKAYTEKVEPEQKPNEE